MKVIKTGVESVDDLYGIEFTGNMIPHSWYAAIQTENGRPDLAAIVILAEILYWHRPTVERTADDAAVIVLKKKFHADLLQMSYAQIEKKLFLSKAQSRRALEKLESLGLIERCLRTVVTESGNKLGNVMYIKLFTQRLLEITFPGYDPCKKFPTRVSAETDKVIGENRQACLSESMTNTKITTEITDTDYTSFYQQERAKVRDQVEYEYLIMDLTEHTDGLLDLLRTCDRVYTIVRDDTFSRARYFQYEDLLRRMNYEDIKMRTQCWKLPVFREIPAGLEDLTRGELAVYIREMLLQGEYGQQYSVRESGWDTR